MRPEPIAEWTARSRVARVLARPSVRAALGAFALSRVLSLGVVLVATRLPGLGPSSPPPFAHLASRGDAAWYLGIARAGYEVRPFDLTAQANWAFFPLYPLTLRSASLLTGEGPLTGVALSSALFLVALVLLFELALAAGLSVEAARRALLVTALWPTALFFSYPTTESLFLALSAGAYLAALRGRPWLAGAAGALATATRPNGFLLVAALGLLQVRRHGWRPRRDWLALALVPLGLVAYMAYLRAITGDPLAFSHIMPKWGRVPGFFLAPLFDYVLHPEVVALSWNFKAVNFAAGVVGLWAAVYWARRRDLPLAAFTALALLMPLSTHSLQSLARYVMMTFPVPLALAQAARSRAAQDALIAVLAVGLAVVSMAFALGAEFAST